MSCISFFSLLVAYIEDGKPGTISGILANKDKQKHPCPLCCIPPVTPGPHFLIVIRQCILQYVITKPLMSATAATLQIIGVYNEGSFDPAYGYLYVTVTVNTSVTISMYCLVLFYLVTKRELAPDRPIVKFACIKAILFFSFWQSVAIGVLSHFKVIPPIGEWSQHEVATALNDFIICIEMFILSLVHPYVFPYQEYMANENGERRVINSPKEAFKMLHEPVKNFSHVVDQTDLLTDIVGSYHPKKVAHAKAEQKRLKAIDKEETKENTIVDLDEAEESEELVSGVTFYRL